MLMKFDAVRPLRQRLRTQALLQCIELVRRQQTLHRPWRGWEKLRVFQNIHRSICNIDLMRHRQRRTNYDDLGLLKL